MTGPSVTVAEVKLRDATQDVLDSLNDVPSKEMLKSAEGPKKPGWVPQDWHPPYPSAGGYKKNSYIKDSDSMLEDGSLQFESAGTEADTQDWVLELQDVDAPKLIAVSWPHGIEPVYEAKPTPFLVYFHSNVGQNAGTYKEYGTYPYGWAYLKYGLWSYVNWVFDPLLYHAYAMGIPYQITQAKKGVALILPLSKVGAEVGVFQDAAKLETILFAIQDFICKQAGVDSPEELGRAALAGFSASTALVASFLAKQNALKAEKQSEFFTKTLQEVYLFDPPTWAADYAANQAKQWSKSGDGGKIIRVYNQWNNSMLGSLVGKSIPAKATGIIESSSDDSRTAAWLPVGCWKAPLKQAVEDFADSYDDEDAKASFRKSMKDLSDGKIDWKNVHSLIPSTMLVDALRRSSF